MTVKELMSRVEPNRVNDAMMLMADYIFSPNNYNKSFMEKFEAVPKHRKIIEENIRAFAECSPKEDVESYTIFIFYTKAYCDLDKKDEMVFDSFATNDNEVLAVLDKDFHMFCEPDDVTVHNYSYDDASLEELACYKIAEESIEQLGMEVCAAHILAEVFFWGSTPEHRKSRVEETLSELCERCNEANEVEKLVPADKVMAEWREELLSDMTDDERKYFLLKENFEEEINEIQRRYWAKGREEKLAKSIKAVRVEYERQNKLKASISDKLN